jgi:hypothetical protein
MIFFDPGVRCLSVVRTLDIEKPSIGLSRGGLALMRPISLPKWPHPLAGTTLPGKAGWRGRQPCSGCKIKDSTAATRFKGFWDDWPLLSLCFQALRRKK